MGALVEVVVVDHARPGLDTDTAPGEPRPQTEVEILAVEEVRVVEPGELLPRNASDHHRRARWKRRLVRGSRKRGRILPALPGPPDAEVVNHAAGGVDPLVGQHHDRLPGGPVGLLGGGRSEPVERLRLQSRVGVQQQQERRDGRLDPLPAAGREPPVVLIGDQ